MFQQVQHVFYSFSLLLLNFEMPHIHPDCVALAARLIEVGLVIVGTATPPTPIHELLVDIRRDLIA